MLRLAAYRVDPVLEVVLGALGLDRRRLPRQLVVDVDCRRVVDQRFVADDPALHRVLTGDSFAFRVDADVDDVVLVVESEIEPLWQN